MDERDNIPTAFAKLSRYFGIVVGVFLVIFEVVICVQYINMHPLLWRIILLVACSLSLDVLCIVELYLVKTLRLRITIYCFDFVFLLVICALTGSAYLSALYCIILTQFYINVEDMKTKVTVLIVSGVAFVVTCVVGWIFNHNLQSITNEEIIDIATGCLFGLLVLVIHFVVGNFLLAFYRNNLKLRMALKEADESKAQLEEAYKQLSETAVFQERNRIARDIHDNVGHSMTSVIMQTEAAKLLIDTDPEQAKAKIISANIQAKNALEQMRESVHLLAGRSQSHTLKEELEEIIAQVMDGTDIKVVSDVADISLAYDRRRFISNSLKECFSNGMRHGGATAFYVELKETEGVVSLTVSDNGTGLPPDFKEGFGIRGMREKAAAFGGSIVFESDSDEGTEITVSIKAEKGDEAQ